MLNIIVVQDYYLVWTGFGLLKCCELTRKSCTVVAMYELMCMFIPHHRN